MALHVNDHRVTTRDQQHDEWELECGIIEKPCIQMRFKMINADEGLVPYKS